MRARAPLPFLPFLCQRELKFGMGCRFIRCLVRALGELPGGFGGFFSFRLRHLGWDQCSHRSTSRPLESCHRQRLQAVCGISGYPRVKLRSCWMAPSSSVAAPPVKPDGLHRRHFLDMVGGSVKEILSLPLILQSGSNTAKHAWLTKKTCPKTPVHDRQVGSRASSQSDGKGWLLLTPQELGERWARLATLFYRLGWLSSPPWAPGICFRRTLDAVESGWLVQPKGPMH